MFRTARIMLLGSVTLLMSACPKNSSRGRVSTRPAETVVPVPEPAVNHPVFPEEEFRQTPPTPGQPRPFQLPPVKRFKIANLIEVFLIERHELPIVTMELQFDGGSINDHKGREGAASLCMSMLTEGTRDLDRQQYGARLADMASGISSSVARERQSLRMSTLRKYFDPTFELFADTLLAPGFRVTDFDRKVKRRKEALVQARTSPGSVASRVYGPVVYGENHPFGQVVTESSLGAVTIAQCRAYHKAYLRPRGARLFVVGDLTQEEITAKFTPLLKTWKGSPMKSASIPKPKQLQSEVYFANVHGAAQSSVYLIQSGPSRKSKDYPANRLMAAILGGGFSSRLNMNLREDKGFSYGARGGIRYNRHFSHFVASSSVHSKFTLRAVEEMLSEISQLQDGTRKATQEELDREKSGAIWGLPASFSTGRQALGMYRGLVGLDLPLDTYDHFVQDFSAVELPAVQAAAGKLLQPSKTLVLVVGDGASLQADQIGGEDQAIVDEVGQALTLEAGLRAFAKEHGAAVPKAKNTDFFPINSDGLVQPESVSLP